MYRVARVAGILGRCMAGWSVREAATARESVTTRESVQPATARESVQPLTQPSQPLTQPVRQLTARVPGFTHFLTTPDVIAVIDQHPNVILFLDQSHIKIYRALFRELLYLSLYTSLCITSRRVFAEQRVLTDTAKCQLKNSLDTEVPFIWRFNRVTFSYFPVRIFNYLLRAVSVHTLVLARIPNITEGDIQALRSSTVHVLRLIELGLKRVPCLVGFSGLSSLAMPGNPLKRLDGSAYLMRGAGCSEMVQGQWQVQMRQCQMMERRAGLQGVPLGQPQVMSQTLERACTQAALSQALPQGRLRTMPLVLEFFVSCQASLEIHKSFFQVFTNISLHMTHMKVVRTSETGQLCMWEAVESCACTVGASGEAAGRTGNPSHSEGVLDLTREGSAANARYSANPFGPPHKDSDGTSTSDLHNTDCECSSEDESGAGEPPSKRQRC